MKYFKSDYNGLLPILLDDLRFIQGAYDEQIEALIKPYLEYVDNDSFILSGCENISGSNYSAGWIVLEGKVYRVPAFTLPTPETGQEVVWHITTTALSGGLKSPKRSASDVNTWYEKTVGPILTLTPTTGVLYSETQRLSSILASLNSDSGWVNLAMNSGWDYEAGDRPQYRKLNNVIHIRGAGTRNGNTDGVIATLPSGMAPSRDMQFYEDLVVETVSGTERIRYTPSYTGVSFKLDSIAYPLD